MYLCSDDIVTELLYTLTLILSLNKRESLERGGSFCCNIKW